MGGGEREGATAKLAGWCLKREEGQPLSELWEESGLASSSVRAQPAGLSVCVPLKYLE